METETERHVRHRHEQREIYRVKIWWDKSRKAVREIYG